MMDKEQMRQKLGNITQIRELLFGEQIEEYERKFTQAQQKNQALEANLEELTSNLESFKSEIKEHLSQIKNSLSREINLAVDSLEKKVKYLNVKTYGELNQLNKEIENKTQINHQKIEILANRTNTQIKSLKEEANQNQKLLNQDVENLKKQLSETIEKNLSDLTETKVSRHDFAEILFELCLKVKGQEQKNTEIESNFSDEYKEKLNGELLLLEEQTDR